METNGNTSMTGVTTDEERYVELLFWFCFACAWACSFESCLLVLVLMPLLERELVFVTNGQTDRQNFILRGTPLG